MKKNERVNKNIKSEKDRIQHKAQQNPEFMVDKYPARDTDQSLLMETPFSSRMDEHAATLSRIPFAVQRQEYIMRLNNTYGNRYVQRLMKSVDGQSRRQDELEEEELLQAKRDVQRQEVPEEEEELLQAKRDVQRQDIPEEEEVQMMPNRRRQEEEELEYPGPRSRYERGDVLNYPGSRMAPVRVSTTRERSSSELSYSTAQRAAPHSSATANIGDAVNLDGEALYGWDRTITGRDVETVVNGVVPTVSSDEEMPRIIIYSGTHGNTVGHLINDATSRGFVAEDQATASAASAADPQVEAEVIDVVTGYPEKSDLTANYGRTNYIRILAWCYSKRSYELSNRIKSNWWQAPDNL